MNWDQVEGKWTQAKGSVKEQWGKLTDDDLDQIAGKRDQLIGKLQVRYGIAKEEAQRKVDEWLHGRHDMADTKQHASDMKQPAGSRK